MYQRVCKTFTRNPQLFQLVAHTQTCPATKPSGGGKSTIQVPDFKRAELPGKCRLGFMPDEWFLFFHSITGVTGPYLFGITLSNYLLSKEIYILEHEYYLGLSMAVMTIIAVKKTGKSLASSLDKMVDAYIAESQSHINKEKQLFETTIKDAKQAQWQAEGQKLLMDAKKDNIAMQLEAAYRERFMHVYRLVKGRMDYHVKVSQSEARIQQKWMIGWILENVRKSITADFEKQALNSAIRDLVAAAGQAK